MAWEEDDGRARMDQAQAAAGSGQRGGVEGSGSGRDRRAATARLCRALGVILTVILILDYATTGSCEYISDSCHSAQATTARRRRATGSPPGRRTSRVVGVCAQERGCCTTCLPRESETSLHAHGPSFRWEVSRAPDSEMGEGIPESTRNQSQRASLDARTADEGFEIAMRTAKKGSTCLFSGLLLLSSQLRWVPSLPNADSTRPATVRHKEVSDPETCNTRKTATNPVVLAVRCDVGNVGVGWRERKRSSSVGKRKERKLIKCGAWADPKGTRLHCQFRQSTPNLRLRSGPPPAPESFSCGDNFPLANHSVFIIFSQLLNSFANTPQPASSVTWLFDPKRRNLANHPCSLLVATITTSFVHSAAHDPVTSTNKGDIVVCILRVRPLFAICIPRFGYRVQTAGHKGRRPFTAGSTGQRWRSHV